MWTEYLYMDPIANQRRIVVDPQGNVTMPYELQEGSPGDEEIANYTLVGWGVSSYDPRNKRR